MPKTKSNTLKNREEKQKDTKCLGPSQDYSACIPNLELPSSKAFYVRCQVSSLLELMLLKVLSPECQYHHSPELGELPIFRTYPRSSEPNSQAVGPKNVYSEVF